MKNIAKITKGILILTLFMGWSLVAMAQGPPPPGNGHNQTGNQNTGGSVPIGGGIALLFGLTAAWVGKKTYQAYQNKE